MSFLDLSLERAYRSSSHALGRDFYAPMLQAASQYRRGSGYFASSVFSVAPHEHVEFFRRGGQMHLVCSESFSRKDLEALSEGVFDRPRVRARWTLASLDVDALGTRIGWPEFLAWAVAADLVVVKIAVPLQRESAGIYHEKIGLFIDDRGNRVAFSGSANESHLGYAGNFERLDVFASFADGAERSRAARIETQWTDLWKNQTAGLRIVPLVDALEEGLLVAHSDEPEPPARRRPRDGFVEPVLATRPEALVPDPAFDPLPHQVAAISHWAAEGGRGILEMATGAGKTIAALTLASRLYDRLGGPFVILVVAPMIHLVDQWRDVARGFGLHPIRCAEGASRWTEELSAAIDAINSGRRPILSIATTAATMSTRQFRDAIERLRRPMLLIGDEAHTYGSRAYHAALPATATYRVGLSATPERWHDDEGTRRLVSYFGPVVYRYGLGDALRDGVLTPYRYFPSIVELNDEESQQYLDLSREIARYGGADEGDDLATELVKRLLIRRARVVAAAQNKLPALRAQLEQRRRDSHILIYCGDGSVLGPDGAEVVRQVREVVRMVGRDLGMAVDSYTSETTPDDRRRLLASFSSGDLQVLVAIRCLDEGVDVPATRTAFLLASSTNPRQFVQRRGRVLRRFPGKARAEVYDFFATGALDHFSPASPQFEAMRGLVRGQLRRVEEFASLAENGPVARGVLRELRTHFRLLDFVG
ncbi:MAG: DEAD/DEAH box helicase family protein [Deltaproteobacteria bacterium]|nr:DEAD/DEAH box helicase family protein [Deltaproteobacteria bacterium]